MSDAPQPLEGELLPASPELRKSVREALQHTQEAPPPKIAGVIIIDVGIDGPKMESQIRAYNLTAPQIKAALISCAQMVDQQIEKPLIQVVPAGMKVK